MSSLVTFLSASLSCSPRAQQRRPRTDGLYQAEIVPTSVFCARAFVLQSLKMDFQNGTNETEGYAMEVIFRDHRPVMVVICSSSLTLGRPLAINMLSQLKVFTNEGIVQPCLLHPM